VNPTYSLYSSASNPSGQVYGIYSYVSGQTGKKWSGYFTGVDVAVMNGNVGIGVTDPQGILQVRGTTDNSWIYFSPNAGTVQNTKFKPRVNYGLSFTWNYSGSEGESIINYTSANGGTSPRLDFTSWDGTNLNTEMTLKKGCLGIGTTTPEAKLAVAGTIKTINGPYPWDNLSMWSDGENSYIQSNDDEKGLHIKSNKANKIILESNVGIGATTPSARLEVYNSAQSGHLVLSGNDNPGADMSRIDLDYKIAAANQTIGRISSAYLTSSNGGSGALRFFTSNNGVLAEKMRIGNTGNVSIGTTETDPTNALLTVKGKIHAQEVIIDMNAPLVPDYVFDDNYKLMPLHQVEQFVKTNNHLPEIPSAAEVQKNGLSMGEMQNKLLQKIEELTLYVIEQQKRIEQLEKNQK
jgi:hypothetical protein